MAKYLCNKLLLTLCHSICQHKLNQNENLTEKYWLYNQRERVSEAMFEYAQSNQKSKATSSLGHIISAERFFFFFCGGIFFFFIYKLEAC